MRERRSVAAVVLVMGLGLTALTQLLAGAATAPLFDGLVVEEPYRFVAPPPSAAADPFAASSVEMVVNGAMPLVAIATEETPPQAQMIAQADAFAIAAGTTSVAVSIQPNAPTDPRILGNVYRFTVTDQAGAPLDIIPGAVVTIVLRTPQPDPAAMVAHLDGGQWVALTTQHGGLPDLYAANITQQGDFAMLGPAAASSAPSAAPSAGPNGSGRNTGIPTWVIALFAIAAVAVGLTMGLLRGGEDD